MDPDKKPHRFTTRLVRAASDADPATGAIAPPIHLSTTFEHGPGGEDLHGFTYIRESNPTQERLQEALANVEGGQSSLVFASGLAAASAFLQAMPQGGHVVVQRDLYHGVKEIVHRFLPRWGMTYTEVDPRSLGEVESAMEPSTCLVWIETPSNPLLQIVDLAAVAQIAHRHGAELMVDGTFASPALQRPLEHGADVVMHSTTKYLGGHSDVQGGALILADDSRHGDDLRDIRKILGGVSSPFNDWLVLRGLRTLGCRMERHGANAMALARWLAEHPKVERVYYPGLPDHPGHDVARRQMSAFGGMVSFTVVGGRQGAVTMASHLRLFSNATSLGGVESLLEHRASSEGPETTTPQNLLRASIGLEDPADLIADLEQALDR